MLHARHFCFSAFFLLVVSVAALLSASAVMPVVSAHHSNGVTEEGLPQTVYLKSEYSISCTDISAQEFLNSYGMLKNGSEFTVKVTLTPTNYSKEIGKTKLFLHSYFIDRGVEPSIWVNGENIGYRNPFEMNPETDKKVEVILSAEASFPQPEVRKRAPITLLKIVQETSKGKYLVVNITKNISSPPVEEALVEMEKAKDEIERAKAVINETGSEEASNYLQTAELHLRNAENAYNEGRPVEAREEAKNAIESARLACEKASAARGFASMLKLVALAVVVVVVVVAVLLLLLKRQRERGKLG